MSYIIHKSDNKTKIAEVPDGSIDQYSTDITLIGKNYSGFGQVLNENFVKLLENFASTDYPARPIKGQLWYDSASKNLKVYSGTMFVPVSSATVSSTQPLSPGVGDLWYDNSDKQMFYWNGTEQVLLGPSYTDSQLLSGLKTLSVLDTAGNTRVVTCVYNNGRLMGLYANDNFSLANPTAISGFTGDISIGFNVGTVDNFKLNATSINSDKLGGYPASVYVKTNTTNALTGQLRVTTDAGIIVGSSGTASLSINSNNVVIANTIQSKSIVLSVKNDTNTTENAITITPSSGSSVGLVDFKSGFLVNIGGDITINGDLLVKGATTSINTNTITVKDKIIELAKPSNGTASDASASGGGIILHGTTNHSITWTTPGSWNSSDDFNLAAGKVFKINGEVVLSADSLGSSITFGTQSQVTIGSQSNTYLKLTGNTISTEYDSSETQNLRLAPIGDIELVKNSNGVRPHITGLNFPDGPYDAANQQYVKDEIKRSQLLILSLDVTNESDDEIGIILDNWAPVGSYLNGTNARVLCNKIVYSSGTGVTITRTYKTFYINNNSWKPIT